MVQLENVVEIWMKNFINWWNQNFNIMTVPTEDWLEYKLQWKVKDVQLGLL